MTKCSGYQELVQSIGDFLHETADEYEEFDNGAEDADIDSIVVVMYPGKPPKVMTESECYDMVESRGTFCSGFTIDDPGICAYGLKAVYDPRTLLPLGSECYIIGPVIVYASDENGDSILWMQRRSWRLSSTLRSIRSRFARTAQTSPLSECEVSRCREVQRSET